MPVVIVNATTPALHKARGGDVLEIGLLNNLSDAGFEGGERQFIDLLRKAAGSRLVRLRLFSLPEIARGARARAHIARTYAPFASLFEGDVDGMIVTGCEPQAARLRDEPFWPGLTQVMDWAERHTRSTIWSCLAAHAAVLHQEGIERRRLPHKVSGVFPVERVRAHRLLPGIMGGFEVPHSRYNDVAERDLASAGYEILTRSPTIGVDAFVREGRSLFVYLQGHPEYDRHALAREYRRDVSRYLERTSETYPSIPENAFDRELETELRAFAARAHQERDRVSIDAFPLTPGSGAMRPWRDAAAVNLYTNWLDAIHAKTPEHAA